MDVVNFSLSIAATLDTPTTELSSQSDRDLHSGSFSTTDCVCILHYRMYGMVSGQELDATNWLTSDGSAAAGGYDIGCTDVCSDVSRAAHRRVSTII